MLLPHGTARNFFEAALRARKRPPRRPSRAAVPVGLEHKYFKFAKALLGVYFARVKERLFPLLPILTERFAEKTRTDAESDVIEKLFAELQLYIGYVFDPETVKRKLVTLAEETEAFNAAQLNGQFREIIGIDVMGNEPWLSERVSAFAAENALLISSIPARLHDEIAQSVIRAVRQGTGASDLASDIEERYGVAESRAALIARDQISKFNGELTKERQTALGVEGYVWRTSGDERVRETHAALEGRKFSWDDPPMVEGKEIHPGTDYQCRCVAEPDFSGVVEED